MGRGRAKAKQTKVARELKYSSGALDAEALRRELASQGGGVSTTQADAFVDDEHEDDEDDEDE